MVERGMIYKEIISIDNAVEDPLAEHQIRSGKDEIAFLMQSASKDGDHELVKALGEELRRVNRFTRHMDRALVGKADSNKYKYPVPKHATWPNISPGNL